MIKLSKKQGVCTTEILIETRFKLTPDILQVIRDSAGVDKLYLDSTYFVYAQISNLYSYDEVATFLAKQLKTFFSQTADHYKHIAAHIVD